MNVFDLVASISLDSGDYEKDLNKAKSDTEDAGNKMAEAGEKSSGFGEKLASVGTTALKVGAAISAAVGTALVAVGKQALDTYGEFEQLEGGAQLMFGEGFQTVAENAKNAWKDVQMSQNEYLAEANKYAVGLKTALGGDEQAAADLAHGIIVAQADIVAATGNSAESVQNAFNGIMKGNYTMLDNLGLGINATKEGFQEVIDRVNEANGTNYNMDNVAEAQQALIDYVAMQGMAGYAAAEGATTIQGSVKTMQSAWENFITALANPEADMGEAMDNLLTSLSGVVEKFLPLIQNMLPKIVEAFTTLGPMLITAIVDMLPTLIPAIVDVVTGLATAIIENAPLLMQALTDGLLMMVDAILPLLPMFMEAAIQIIVSIVDAISANADTLIPVMIECLLIMIQALVDNLPLLVDAAVKLVVAITEGILKSLPEIVKSGVQIIGSLVKGLLSAINSVLEGVGQILDSIISGFANGISKVQEVGLNLVKGLVDGILGAIDWVKTKILGFTDKVVGFFKKGFDTHSPSRITTEIGKFVGLGVAEGVEDSLPEVLKSVKHFGNKTVGWLNAEIEPFYQTIDDFRKRMHEDLINESEQVGFQATISGQGEVANALGNIIQAAREELQAGGEGERISSNIWDMLSGISHDVKVYNEEGAYAISGILENMFKDLRALDDEQALTEEQRVEKMLEYMAQGQRETQGYFDTIQRSNDASKKLQEYLSQASEREKNSITAFFEKMTYTFEDISKKIDVGLTQLEDISMDTRELVSPKLANNNSITQNITINREVESASEMARAIRLESRYGLMTGVAFG